MCMGAPLLDRSPTKADSAISDPEPSNSRADACGRDLCMVAGEPV